jgi:hypothetical protein
VEAKEKQDMKVEVVMLGKMEEWIKEGDGGEYDQSMQYTCLKMSQ